ncbi:MAG: ATP-binding protein [bacterium]
MSTPNAQFSSVQSPADEEASFQITNPLPTIRKPFVGLVSLDEDSARLLAGREEEVLVLTTNLQAARLTLLYGASGVGKSSILRAGVVASLREKGRSELHNFGTPSFAVAIMNTWAGDPFKELEESVRQGIKKALDVEAIAPMLFSTHPLEPMEEIDSTFPTQATDLVATLRAWTNCYGLELLIILDQFEEFFVYHPEDGLGTFAYEFPLAVAASDLRVRFLVSLRDDALYKLDLLQHRIPGLFENRLQVTAMTMANANQAIHKAISSYNEGLPESDHVRIEDSLVDEVLLQVRSDNLVPGYAGIGPPVFPSLTEPVSLDPAKEAHIDAPYMQLVMERLWEEESAGWQNNTVGRVMRLETLKRLGGAQAVVDQHLDKVMKDFSRAENAIAQDCFYRLVTPAGTKYALTPEELSKWTDRPANLIQSFLEKLAGTKYRIVRRVDKLVGNGTQAAYEAHHDRIALAMLAWHSRRREQEVRNRNRFRLLVVGVIIAALVISSTLYRESSRQTQLIAAEEKAADHEKVKLENEFATVESNDPRLEKFATLKGLVPKFTCTNTATELRSDADKINKALEVDCVQYKQIIEQIKEAPKDAIPVRLYIQIQDEAQRETADDLRSWLRAAKYQGSPNHILVPGIENVGAKKLRASQIRYFHQSGDEINWAWLISTSLRNICIEATPKFITGFEESDSVRQRHFELWLTSDALAKRCDTHSSGAKAQ